jgi:hypothetical protein
MSSFQPEKIRKLVIAAMLAKNCARELTFDLAACDNASPRSQMVWKANASRLSVTSSAARCCLP